MAEVTEDLLAEVENGHGGIATTHPGGYFAPDGYCFCKRCGARVKLI